MLNDKIEEAKRKKNVLIARKKRAELAANLDYVNDILAGGATKARILARTVLKRARKNCGLE